MFEGMTTTMAITILQIPQLDLLEVADVLDWVFMILPQYNLGIGLVQISSNSQLHRFCPSGFAPPLYFFDCNADKESPRCNQQCCEKCKECVSAYSRYTRFI